MPIRPELLDELLQDCQNPQDWLGEGGILKQLTKAIVDRALDAEMDTHLQATKQSAAGKPDRRKGHSQKTLKGEFGQVSIEVPRNLRRVWDLSSELCQGLSGFCAPCTTALASWDTPF